MIIGVFDSGMGGLSVANAIEKALPEHRVLFVNDTKNVPYGKKTPEVLLNLVAPILQKLESQGCEVIVVACNTVSTTLITELRQTIKVPLIAMEPMVKTAAERTKTGVITVCATPTTLASKRYAWLKSEYAKNIQVVEPDCSNWTEMIESDTLDREAIAKIIDDSCEANSDTIVLGCTHYHWIEDEIKEMAAGKAVVLQPEQPVIRQLKRVIEQTS